jgi:hypothetical protein
MQNIMACVCHPTYTRKLKIAGLRCRLNWAKSGTASPELKGLEAWLK